MERTPIPDAQLRRRLALAPRMLPEDARRANRSLVLRALHHGGPASRADLAKLVGLTPATVSSVMRDLINTGLVEELGLATGNVGKPATVVGVAPDGRHVAAVSLSDPDQIDGAIVDLDGKVVAHRTAPRDDRTGAAAADLVGDMAAELVAGSDRPILGVGVASPGIVEPSGVVARAARLGWHHLDLAGPLARRTGVPVHVANDANAAALAHLTFDHAPTTDFVLVRVGQGVGVGLVLDGALFRGVRAAAGEIGHVVVDPDGAPCTCGKRGCLETVISAPLLTSTETADDPRVLATAGEHLGTALATVVSTLDIGNVVLSGPAPVASEPFRAAIAAAVAARTMPEISDDLVIRPTSFGDDDVILGAAAMVLDAELGIR